MDKDIFTIKLLCLFCSSPLVAEEGKEFTSGDMFECTACGELNDYDSLLEVAKEKGLKKVEEQVTGEIEKTLKDLFK